MSSDMRSVADPKIKNFKLTLLSSSKSSRYSSSATNEHQAQTSCAKSELNTIRNTTFTIKKVQKYTNSYKTADYITT